MDFFTRPKQFSPPHPPKGYTNHVPELVFHALHHLHASSMDRSCICEFMNGVNFNESWVIICQTQGGYTLAGTFQPGKVQLDEELRAQITTTYYFAKNYFGGYVLRKFDGQVISTPFSLERLALDPDFAWALFDLDNESLQWLDGEKPEADYEVPYCTDQWFGFTHEYKGGLADFSTWKCEDGIYRAKFLKEKALFDITVRPHTGDNGEPLFDVDMSMYDYRPRCDYNAEPVIQGLTNTLGLLDRFSIRYHEALGGDMSIQKDWKNLKVTV